MKSRKLNIDGDSNNQPTGNAYTRKLQKVQTRLDEISKEISEMQFIGVSGGGVVEVLLKGDKTLVNIKVKEESKKELQEDFNMLFDMIIAACSDAQQKIDDYTDSEIAKITQGLPIPGLN